MGKTLPAVGNDFKILTFQFGAVTVGPGVKRYSLVDGVLGLGPAIPGLVLNYIIKLLAQHGQSYSPSPYNLNECLEHVGSQVGIQ